MSLQSFSLPPSPQRSSLLNKYFPFWPSTFPVPNYICSPHYPLSPLAHFAILPISRYGIHHLPMLPTSHHHHFSILHHPFISPTSITWLPSLTTIIHHWPSFASPFLTWLSFPYLTIPHLAILSHPSSSRLTVHPFRHSLAPYRPFFPCLPHFTILSLFLFTGRFLITHITSPLAFKECSTSMSFPFLPCMDGSLGPPPAYPHHKPKHTLQPPSSILLLLLS